MFKLLLLSCLVTLAACRPGIIHDDSSSGGISFGGHGQSISFLPAGGGHGLSLEGGHSLQGGSYGVLEGHGGGDEGSSHEGGGGGGGDFHHGVSVVGLGGGKKAVSFDLTKGGGGHGGPFGGSFVASSKYSAGGHGGGGGHEGLGGHGGYAVSEGGFEGHYSDVLGASEGGDHGGWEGGQELSLGGHGWN